MAVFLIQLGMMSAQASVAILAVLIVRKVFALLGVSKKYVMLLWMIPFLLLICPWKLSSPVGFWNIAPSDYEEVYTEYALEQWQGNTGTGETLQSNLSEEEIGGNGIENMQGQFEPDESNSVTEYQPAEQKKWNPRNIWHAAEIIWSAGAAALFFYAGILYVILRRKVKFCVQKTEGVYFVDDLPVPIVLGLVHPKIYLPSGVAEEYITYVVEHERTHIRRKDTLVKPAAYMIVCLHWFNPMVWLAYYFLEKDMEMACDEETIGRIGMEEKKQYATALVQLSAGEHRIFAMPLAFGEGDTKGRIKNVMHYKKTMRIAAVFAVALGFLLLVVFMSKNADESKESTDAEKVLTFERLREIEKNNAWASTDFLTFENQEQEEGTLISFRELEYNDETYSLWVSYDETMNEVEMVRIRQNSNGDGTTLFSVNGGFTESLADFFAGKINIGYWMDVDLPEGYALKDAVILERQECSALIVPQAYELYSDNLYASEQWYYAGAVGRFPSGGSYFSFENGKLKALKEKLWNCRKEEVLGVLDLDWQALMMRYEYPLYMQEAVIELENRGENDLSKVETTSEYWYFYFAEEGEHEAYYLSLSTKLFSKEEAIAIAKTVDIKRSNKLPMQDEDAEMAKKELLDLQDLEWQTLFVQMNHDLYTAAGTVWLEEDGVDVSTIDTTSDYWYFFFAKEGEDRAYYLSLSKKEFTKEEAITIARTVDMKE